MSVIEKCNQNQQEQPIIKVENLTKDYGSGRGVFGVSFSIYKGEVFGFLGPNGAGKSTTIRHLLGFSKPDRGNTYIFNQQTFTNYSNILSHIGYIPGEIALPQGLTGWEFIRMMQNLQGIKNEERLNMLISLFKITEQELKSETKKMSLGVKRKLAIITAFMSNPDVLILDEPTSGLDPLMQEIFINFIKNEKKLGKTILLSSHIFSEVDATCDRIAIIKDGMIVSEFVANDLKHTSLKYYVITFEDETEVTRFAKLYDSCIKQNNKIILPLEDTMVNNLIKTLKDFKVTSFSNYKESLQDYFMRFYKEDKTFGGDLI